MAHHGADFSPALLMNRRIGVRKLIHILFVVPNILFFVDAKSCATGKKSTWTRIIKNGSDGTELGLFYPYRYDIYTQKIQ